MITNNLFTISDDIDLHMHTTYSDGSDTVPELFDKILSSDIRVFSITDHDSIMGSIEMESLVNKHTTTHSNARHISFIPGVELSCVSPAGKCHILGYNYDKNNKDLLMLIDKVKSMRKNNLDKRLDFLKNIYSITFSQKEIDWLYSLNNAGKPHLAKLIIAQHKASTISEAITKYLLACDTVSAKINATEGIKAISRAGGIPIWAHPLGGEGERRLSLEEFNCLYGHLKECGIKGLECYYSRYTHEEIEFLKETAATDGLLITGGSDYHGTNKSIVLGTLCSD